MAIRGIAPGRARREAFAPRFGHLPILGTELLQDPFREYTGWLRHHRIGHTPARFRSWLEDVYRS